MSRGCTEKSPTVHGLLNYSWGTCPLAEGSPDTVPHTALVIIPTYNERESIEHTLPRVLGVAVDVLVVDDNSPDGTGDYVAELAAAEPRITLLRRERKQGL